MKKLELTIVASLTRRQYLDALADRSPDLAGALLEAGRALLPFSDSVDVRITDGSNDQTYLWLGEEEGGHPAGAKPTEEWQRIIARSTPPDDAPCIACEGQGWLHMNDSMGLGPGIERCDDCNRFESDEQAAEAHAKACTCGLKVAMPR